MELHELLIKKKNKKKKVLKEGMFDAWPPVNIGGIQFTPPFYPFGTKVQDHNHQVICDCVNEKVAKQLSEILCEYCHES